MQAIHCRRCKRVLGETDGARLIISGLTFERTVTFTDECGKRMTFVPAASSGNTAAARLVLAVA